MGKFAIQPLPWYTGLADTLMVPVMFVLRGFKIDSLQKTHAWHIYDIDPKEIDMKLTVQIYGKDTTIYHGRYGFLFHAPIFGGWKQFSVFEVDKENVPFHIGWVVYDSKPGEVREARLQKLPIRGRRIRMLDGPPSFKTFFFAVNGSGDQVPLRLIGQGRLGDGKYLDVQLF